MAETLLKLLDLWKNKDWKFEEVQIPPIIGDFSQIASICKKNKVDRIVVALNERREKMPVEQLLLCRLRGIRVEEGESFYEQLCGKLSVEALHPSTLIFSNGFKRSMNIRKLKRGIDILCSLPCMVLLFPLCLAVALAIKFESGGPVFYRQERIGEEGAPFIILKFRSMWVDAEKDGPVWADVNDERITKVGRIIRKLRLDEIPRIINVLRGEMSLVGARPERPFFVQRLQKEIPFYFHRHSVKPGITGWAQVLHPYGASKEAALEKLKYDLYYIKHMSTFMDVMILLKTIKIVLLGKGSR